MYEPPVVFKDFKNTFAPQPEPNVPATPMDLSQPSQRQSPQRISQVMPEHLQQLDDYYQSSVDTETSEYSKSAEVNFHTDSTLRGLNQIQIVGSLLRHRSIVPSEEGPAIAPPTLYVLSSTVFSDSDQQRSHDQVFTALYTAISSISSHDDNTEQLDHLIKAIYTSLSALLALYRETELVSILQICSFALNVF